MPLTIAPYHIFRLGIKQSRTVTVGTNTVIVDGDDYLDPTVNSSVLDLNAMTNDPVNSTYGIKDGSIDMSFKERTLYETTTKGKHGGQFVDYQFQNRVIKLTLAVNIQPALNAGTSVSDYINAAVSNVSRLFQTAYQYSVSKGSQSGAPAVEGLPVILMVQLNNSTNPVYFDVMGGEIDTKPLYNSVSYSRGFAEFNVDIKCKYAGRGDLVYLQNAVINGNFVRDSYGKIDTYWSFVNNDSTHGNFAYYNAASLAVLPPIEGTMQNTALSYTGYSTVLSATFGTQVLVTHGEQFILDFWYTCHSASGSATGSSINVAVSYQEITSSTNSTGTGSVINALVEVLDCSNTGSGAVAGVNGQYVGKHVTSAPFTITGSYNPSTNPNGLFLIQVIIATVSSTGAERIQFFANQVSLLRFPAYAPSRLVVAPKTEYVNVVPTVATDALTTVYGLRGDIEAGCEIVAEPLFPPGASLPQLQTLSIGMRQRIGKALPPYISFNSTTTVHVAQGVVPQWAGHIPGNISFPTDKLSRNYKLILVATTTDVVGMAIQMLRSNFDFFTNIVLPSSIQSYLPSTGSYSQVALDCGVVSIPADNGGHIPTLQDVGTGGPTNFNLLFTALPGVTGSSANINVYELFLIPADQYCYIDTRHLPIGASANTALADSVNGWCTGYPLTINSTKESVDVVISDFTGVGGVTNLSPLHLNSPLRFFPAQKTTWRQTNSGNPITADDTMPMEIAYFPRLPDYTQTDYIAKNNNGNAGTDMMMYFKYYPLYSDLNGGN